MPPDDARPRWNRLAIAGFVLAISSSVALVAFFGGFPGLVGQWAAFGCGVAARNQIRRSSERGYALAMIALLIVAVTHVVAMPIMCIGQSR